MSGNQALPGQRPEGWVYRDPVADAMQGMTTDQKLLVENQVAQGGPSVGVAYVLWALLGLLSAHRFYLGRPASAFFQIVLNLMLVGLVWTLIDAFLIPGMVRATRERARRDLISRIS